MAVFKCKMCGANLEISENQSVATCEYCGTQQTLPKFDNERKIKLFTRANHLRFNCEFDKAAGIYESIVTEFPDEAEAYWGLVLCKYGIEYVDDGNGKRITTCHRTLPKPIVDDEDFALACDYANTTSKTVYKKEAKVIDGIQKKILEIAATEKPYDIFICYKETDDETGQRTEDSLIAQDIYTELIAEGYRVFFARASLRSVAGREYEPHIYSALSSAKMFIVVGTKPEYLDAVWVKNEWSRYLNMMHFDQDKQFIPCYKDIDAYDLPKEFKNMQALNISDVTFFHNLISIIKKSISKSEADADTQPSNRSFKSSQHKSLVGKFKENKRLKTISLVSVAFLLILSVVFVLIFRKLPDYNAAKELLSTGKYAEATWAFDELDGFLKSDELKEAAETSWRKSISSIAAQSYMGGGTGAAYSSYYIDENGIVNNFNHDDGDDHFNVIKQEKGKISSLASGFTIYALTENGDVINEDQNNLVKDSSEWQNIVQILPALEDTNIALRSDGRIVAGKESDNLHNLSDEALKWENIVKIDCGLNRATSGDIMEAVLVGIDNKGDVHVDTYGESGDVLGLDTLKNLTDIIDIDVQLFLSEVDFVALTNYGSVISYIDGTFSETEAPDIIDVELAMWEDTTYCTLDSKGNLCIKNGQKVMSDVVYINDGFFVTKNGSIFGLVNSYDSLISELVMATEGTTKILDEWLIKSELEIQDIEYETQIKTKYLTFDLPPFWKGNWEIEEHNGMSFSIYEKSGFNNNRQGELVSIVLNRDEDYDPASYDKLGAVTIGNVQYTLYAIYPTDLVYENEFPVIYSKMKESLNSLFATIKSNENCELTKYDSVKDQYKIGTFSSDAAELNIEYSGDKYNISFYIWRLAILEGVGIDDGDGILFNAIDASDEDMTMRITYEGSTATVTIEDSNWEYLDNGEKFVLEKVNKYY